MKNYRHIITLAILTFALVCRSQSTNTFGIYLTAQPVDARSLSDGKGDWLHAKLEPTPVISEADIQAYDFRDHSFSLKPGAREKCLKRLPSMTVWGIPFVVVVNGERIYAGAFMTPVSSSSMPLPSIMVWPGGDREDKLQIDRGYPPPAGFATGPDPRSDKRIRNALAALGKLK